jgi:hypothetical protein
MRSPHHVAELTTTTLPGAAHHLIRLTTEIWLSSIDKLRFGEGRGQWKTNGNAARDPDLDRQGEELGRL